MSDVSLPPGLSDAATEIVQYKIHIMILARRHDRGGLFGSTHDATRCHELDSKLRAVNSCGKAFQLFRRLSPHRVSIQSVSFARRRVRFIRQFNRGPIRLGKPLRIGPGPRVGSLACGAWAGGFFFWIWRARRAVFPFLSPPPANFAPLSCSTL